MTYEERNEIRELSKQVAVLSERVENLTKIVESTLSGNTANCAAEKAKIADIQTEIEKLWKTRASAISLNLLWTINLALIGAFIAFVLK